MEKVVKLFLSKMILFLCNLILDSLHFFYQMFKENHTTYYLFLSDYATTIFKSQGKILGEVTVWLDKNFAAPGQAYIVFSRVPKFCNIHLLERVKSFQLNPIKYASPLEIEKEL